MFRGIESGYSIKVSGNGKSMVIGSSLSAVLYTYDREDGWEKAVNGDFKAQLDPVAIGPYTVAISDDGTTVALASHRSRTQGINTGSVQIMKMQSDQTWEQMGRTLTGRTQGALFGHSVDLTDDGSKVIIGAYGVDKSFIYDYSESKKLWDLTRVLQPVLPKIAFGYAVAISGDGERAIVGAPFANNKIGYASIYDLKSFQFIHTINGDIEGAQYGSAVDISKDGNVATLGAPLAGHVFVSTYSSATTSWGKMGFRLSVDEDEAFGTSVALSSNGHTIAIGAPMNSFYGLRSGHVYVYEYSDIEGDWVNVGDDFYGSFTSDRCGESIALSSDSKKLAVSCAGSDDSGLNSGRVCLYRSAATGDDDDFIFPSLIPTTSPSFMPSVSLSSSPTTSPFPSMLPTMVQAAIASPPPTLSPTANPTKKPTVSPTMSPTKTPTMSPTENPTQSPTISPTSNSTSNSTSSKTTNNKVDPRPLPPGGRLIYAILGLFAASLTAFTSGLFVV